MPTCFSSAVVWSPFLQMPTCFSSAVVWSPFLQVSLTPTCFSSAVVWSPFLQESQMTTCFSSAVVSLSSAVSAANFSLSVADSSCLAWPPSHQLSQPPTILSDVHLVWSPIPQVSQMPTCSSYAVIWYLSLQPFQQPTSLSVIDSSDLAWPPSH